jgi:hypothetical protein
MCSSIDHQVLRIDFYSPAGYYRDPCKKRLGAIMVSVISTSLEDRVINPWSGQTRSHDYVSEWNNVSL